MMPVLDKALKDFGAQFRCIAAEHIIELETEIEELRSK